MIIIIIIIIIITIFINIINGKTMFPSLMAVACELSHKTAENA